MSLITQIGADAYGAVDGIDISKYLQQMRNSSNLGAVDSTRFQPTAYFRNFVAGLRGGALGFSGCLPPNEDGYLPELQGAFANPRAAHIYMVCPAGPTTGNLCRIGNSILSQSHFEETVDGLIAYSADMEKTAASPGGRSGVSLFSPYGGAAATINLNEIQDLTYAGVSGTVTVTVPANSTGAGGTFAIAPGDSAGTVQTAARLVVAASGVAVTGAPTADSATYSASGAGTAAYNGSYALVGTHNGQPYYQIDSTHLLWYDTSRYVLGAVLDSSPDYQRSSTGTNPAGAYAAVGGVAPGPTVALGTATYSGTYRLTWAGGQAALNVPQPTTNDVLATFATIRDGRAFTNANTVTGTGGGGSVQENGTTATTAGAFAVLQVLYAASSPSLTVQIQSAADSGGSAGVFSTLGTFSAIDSVGGYLLSIPFGTSVGPWVRANVSAITGTFIISVGFARLYLTS